MNDLTLQRHALRVCAWAGCLLVLAMVLIYVATGVGQDPLQFMHTPADYNALLLRNPAALRAALGLDDAFMLLYGTVFVLLALELLRHGAPRLLVGAALGLLLGTVVLDMLENFHFLTMLQAAEIGLPAGEAEIRAQVGESLLKFHVSYLGLLLLGLALPRATAAQRLLANLLLFVQMPVGVAIYVTPAAIAVPLVFARFTFFVVALALAGWIFGAGTSLNARAAAGSGAPA